MLPHLFILLPGKSGKIGSRIYNTVLYGKEFTPTLEPESLMTDFEKGSITGFLKIYLNTRDNKY